MRCVLAGHARHVHVVARRHGAIGREAFDGVARLGELRVFAIGSSEMKVAPVDAQIVAGSIEDTLVARANVENGETLGARTSPGHGFIRGVDGDDRIHIDKYRDARDRPDPVAEKER